ncbi:helix-turn-helix domain-containing protein [Aureimonas ureilytica]|uniref:helix-turn-helix domain-containing protein n=1 Tax=Aureimonas ureilytica TaxID=401562 RepID=UPI0003617723|nr:helix-turn-helix transcriptional regulator [Aureimonas ureilytica]
MGQPVLEPESLDRDLGRCLRRLREAREIPLAMFARRIGVSDADLRSYEDGTCCIPVRVVRRVADILGVHVIDLFRVDAVPDAEPPPTVH